MTIPKGFVKFSAWVFLAGIASTVIFIIVFNSLGRAVDYPAVISNLVYSVVNVLSGVMVVLSGINKKNSVFFSRLMGSILVRVLIMTGYVVVGLAVFKFEEVNFVLSLFMYYFLFLVLEMFYILPNKDGLLGGGSKSAEGGETKN